MHHSDELRTPLTRDMKLCLATPFPASPAKSPPSKKTKKQTESGDFADILNAIQELLTKQDATFQKLISSENSTDATTKAVDNLSW